MCICVFVQIYLELMCASLDVSMHPYVFAHIHVLGI